MTPRRVIGLVPAAGFATRLGPLPCSKEVLPVGTYDTPGGPKPKAVMHYLLEKFRRAGITEAYVVLRDGKWDIPAYFRDGALVDLRLAYLVVPPTAGPPYTLDYAYPFVRDAIVALGFPDILFTPDDAYARLLAHQEKTGDDVVLGLFPADRPETTDAVACDGRGRVTQVVPKPKQTNLKQTWGIAVWTPAFTRFVHDHLERRSETGKSAELHVGHVVQAAIDAGMTVAALTVSDRPFFDLGTPEQLENAMASLGTPASPSGSRLSGGCSKPSGK